MGNIISIKSFLAMDSMLIGMLVDMRDIMVNENLNDLPEVNRNRSIGWSLTTFQ